MKALLTILLVFSGCTYQQRINPPIVVGDTYKGEALVNRICEDYVSVNEERKLLAESQRNSRLYGRPFNSMGVRVDTLQREIEWRRAEILELSDQYYRENGNRFFDFMKCK